MRDLYQQVILDHNKFPHHFGGISSYSHQSRGYNPLCGDDYTIQMQIQNDQIQNISFLGKGCAISKASASIMTDLLIDLSIDEAKNMFKAFQSMLKGEDSPRDLGKAKVFAQVKNFPSRIKCANLAWHAMKSALNNEKIARTE